MAVPVNKIRENSMSKINSLNITQNKESFQYKSRSDAAKPQGKLEEEIFDLYYDNDSTITTALDTSPGGGRIQDSENSAYNQEKVFEFCERNAPYLWVSNDAAAGGATLFVICSHKADVAHFTKERPIYPGQFKCYKNVYEVRLRSPTQGLPYRVSEYELGEL